MIKKWLSLLFLFAMKEIITMDNIVLNLPKEPHEDAIRRCGEILVKSGYVLPRYRDGMLARDRGFTTAIGNYIAIPHVVAPVVLQHGAGGELAVVECSGHGRRRSLLYGFHLQRKLWQMLALPDWDQASL